ncbi:MAG TPA: carbamoyltransferase HypF, partial [Blastocatellia bacterium]|nr:carbamoyltransferase HypF [Blastocatellia bacterium]
MKPKDDSETYLRLHVAIRGAVQGVGFRPFIYRLATGLGLKGWVNNSSQGVFIDVEGARENLESFLLRIEQEKPPRSFVQSLESSFLDPSGYKTFEIRASDTAGNKTAFVLPDIASCKECLGEVLDPENRRYLYPFTNCTNCGPRFTIIEALPYDRPNTTMSGFPMCDACLAEYENPLSRRFHAQPNACPACGPHIELWDRAGAVLSSRDSALAEAAKAIGRGEIVAVKGLGGFHLMVDAGSDEAVRRLRSRKRREEKPFALMCPDLDAIKAIAEVSELEHRLLASPEAPVVLLRRLKQESLISLLVAPGNPYLGVMMAYTPLHYLLMKLVGSPVVATSGNLSDEPICTDEYEALDRLGQIADLFLVHNRPIARHVDDSVVRVIMGRELVLRRARGYAPLPIHIGQPSPPVLAVGAHLKNSIAASVDSDVFLSQHIGDLETAEAFSAFQGVISSFERLYELHPSGVACDEHPGYLSTQFAEKSELPVIRVQHHYAHVLSCMAENGLQEPALGIAWDGTGLGADGTIWGGEFLRIPPKPLVRPLTCPPEDDPPPFQRVAHLRTFRLPGGEKAVREPRRSAIGLLYEMFGDEVFDMKHLAPVAAFSDQEATVIKAML